MKIGMNLLLWTTHVDESFFPLIAELKNTGFDGIEFPVGEGNQKHYSNMRKELDRQDLQSTVVTSLAAETNPASPDPAIRQAAIERLKWAIEITATLEGEVMCGPFHSAFKEFSGNAPTEDENKWSADVLSQAAEVAEKAEIILAIEPINRFECYLVNTVASAVDLVKRVGHPNLRMIYDTHHSNIEEKNPLEALKNCSEVLGHVHISENDRGTPGKGQINWEKTFDALKQIKYDRWLVIEAFSTIVPEFASAINVWRDFSPSEEVYKEGFRFIKKMWAM
jgi:D-psicose/D-tagatose/L-ribulose 3-epimerase